MRFGVFITVFLCILCLFTSCGQKRVERHESVAGSEVVKGEGVISGGLERAPEVGPLCRSSREGSGEQLRISGTLLTEAGVIRGSVVIAGERIVCAGENCEGDGLLVECEEGVISPGFVNPHDHIAYGATAPVPHPG